MIHLKRISSLTLIFLLFAGCQSVIHRADNPSTLATLWMQHSAEYKALSLQAYLTAERNLPVALNDKTWTASVEQSENYTTLPPAIILDLDETALDNSYYQARLIKDGETFNPSTWNNWVREAQATALKEVVPLTKKADSLGIEVFYITNRDHITEEETIRNLRELGFPISDTLNSVMTNGAQENWTSAKVERRKWVSDRFRVLMIFGDDLNDFLPARTNSMGDRDQMVLDHADKWGVKWFMLPNPVYGSWERALIDREPLSEEEKKDRWLELLETKR
ncbi:MAG: 5'-nucleotidase, lipoprotein e(P4) family [Balneolaceae bacterium]